VTDSDGFRGHVSVLIVGSGFAGLGAAIRLEQSGRHDFVVIERGSDVGGTWRDNSYPGAACDIPSHLYSFSFALNPDWSLTFSPQPEIQDYLRRTAVLSGTLDRHVFDCELRSAQWDAGAARWRVQTSRGHYTATVLVTAFGGLCEPAMPDIPGIHQFQGRLFHSSRWDASAELEGRRVAVIGTGASAIQLIPPVAAQVGRLDIYQRTAPWILPRRDRRYTRAERIAFRHLPGYQRAVRGLLYVAHEAMGIGFCYLPAILGLASRKAKAHLDGQISDPDLRARLTPAFRMGCKRILLSNDYYPAVARPNVELVTNRIARITASSIVTEDGIEREADTVIIATGFLVRDSPAAERVKRADGMTMGEVWRRSGQQAYRGTAVAGFPNLFSLVGPNTGLGHNSMIYMIESQLNYLLDALELMDRRSLSSVEVRESSQETYNAALQRRMAKTVWASGCSSWYLDTNGRNTTLWPSLSFLFRMKTRHFDLDAYQTSSRPTGREPAVAGMS
jgi:cation diffusion facilitator CzcD-associated flavoprotein CzcO